MPPAAWLLIVGVGLLTLAAFRWLLLRAETPAPPDDDASPALYAELLRRQRPDMTGADVFAASHRTVMGAKGAALEADARRHYEEANAKDSPCAP